MATEIKNLTVQCCRCKKIRIDNLWLDLPVEKENQDISHGICPDCTEVLYPDYA
jgi:hypothetical protein